jgi:two-component system response regulator RegX3
MRARSGAKATKGTGANGVFGAKHAAARESRDNRRGRADPPGVHILLVEDDETIAEPLERALEREGFDVDRVASGAAAVNPEPGSGAADPDLVLLDLGLPDIDGYEVCRQLRARSDVPIVFLTARSAEEDRVAGLELGGDDYVVKPFGVRELVARIRAVSRRHHAGASATAAAAASSLRDRPDVTEAGRLVIDRRTHRVLVGGEPVALTPKEFDLLALLADDPGAVYERHVLLERVWGHPWFGPTKTLDVHIAGIRRKLGHQGWVEAVRGVGFRLCPQD